MLMLRFFETPFSFYPLPTIESLTGVMTKGPTLNGEDDIAQALSTAPFLPGTWESAGVPKRWRCS